MQTEPWNALLLRVTREDAEDIDDLVAAHDPRSVPAAGRAVFPPVQAALAPTAGLKRPDAIVVGVGIDAPADDAAERALRLAAFGLERDVEIVILSGADTTGLGRYGFRVERVPDRGDPARADFERQIRQFWTIDLVL